MRSTSRSHGPGWFFQSWADARMAIRNSVHWGIPSGKRLNNELERSTIFKGKTHCFDWAMFNSYIKLPEGASFEVLFVEGCGRLGLNVHQIWYISLERVLLDHFPYHNFPCGEQTLAQLFLGETLADFAFRSSGGSKHWFLCSECPPTTEQPCNAW